MKIPRRSFFATLFAPLVAKAIGIVKRNPKLSSGPIDCWPPFAERQKKALSDGYEGNPERPVMLPKTARRYRTKNLRLSFIWNSIYDCTRGQVTVRYIVVSQDGWNFLWSGVPNSGSALNERGYATFILMGCEVVVDRHLSANELWLVSQGNPRDGLLHACITVEAYG